MEQMEQVITSIRFVNLYPLGELFLRSGLLSSVHSVACMFLLDLLSISDDILFPLI